MLLAFLLSLSCVLFLGRDERNSSNDLDSLSLLYTRPSRAPGNIMHGN